MSLWVANASNDVPEGALVWVHATLAASDKEAVAKHGRLWRKCTLPDHKGNHVFYLPFHVADAEERAAPDSRSALHVWLIDEIEPYTGQTEEDADGYQSG